MNYEERMFDVYTLLLNKYSDKLDPITLADNSMHIVRKFSTSADAWECHDKRVAEAEGSGKSLMEILDLDVRSYNCLRAENILTLDQLCRCTERDLLRVPNLGRKSLNIIREGLAKIGRTLGERK